MITAHAAIVERDILISKTNARNAIVKCSSGIYT